MKNFSIKLYATAFLFLVNLKMFATPTETTDGVENPETPIDSKLLWLFIAGLVFAFYYFNSERKKQIKE